MRLLVAEKMGFEPSQNNNAQLVGFVSKKVFKRGSLVVRVRCKLNKMNKIKDNRIAIARNMFLGVLLNCQ